jgi:hypothetical protein
MTNLADVSSSAPNAIPISNLLSLAALKIFPSRKNSAGEILKGGHATAFFWKNEDVLYLITNWHNVCAWDPIQGRALSEKAFTPNCLDFTVELRHDLEDGRIKRDRRQATIDLFDEAGHPQWLEHPKFGRQVDVVGLKLGNIGDAILLNQPLNAYQNFTDFDVVVGDDAFVLGFPLGLDGGPGLPIWKRASIATESHYNLDGLPKLLIDTATRKGMSGGPVIAVRRGFTTPRGAKNLSESFIGITETFLGVYSGRIGDDPLGVQLGIVWKAPVIDEIVRGGLRGKSPFCDATM